MSTRKLILTALVCGLAVMLAGGIKLFQMATEDVEAVVFSLGTSQTLADMTVSVTKVDQGVDATLVTVTMVGVEGSNAAEGWRLLANGIVLSPVLSKSTCRDTTAEAVVTCVVGFPESTGSVTVAYLRAGEQSQWAP
jgi:deoxyribose-phosphate aldolase